MDEAEGRSLHEGDARTERAQQAYTRSLHERFIEEVEVRSLPVFALEVDCEALVERHAQQVVRKEVDG